MKLVQAHILKNNNSKYIYDSDTEKVNTGIVKKIKIENLLSILLQHIYAYCIQVCNLT